MQIYELIKIELDKNNLPTNREHIQYCLSYEAVWNYLTKDGTSDVEVSILNDNRKNKEYIVSCFDSVNAIIVVKTPSYQNEMIGLYTPAETDYYYVAKHEVFDRFFK